MRVGTRRPHTEVGCLWAPPQLLLRVSIRPCRWCTPCSSAGRERPCVVPTERTVPSRPRLGKVALRSWSVNGLLRTAVHSCPLVTRVKVRTGNSFWPHVFQTCDEVSTDCWRVFVILRTLSAAAPGTCQQTRARHLSGLGNASVGVRRVSAFDENQLGVEPVGEQEITEEGHAVLLCVEPRDPHPLRLVEHVSGAEHNG